MPMPTYDQRLSFENPSTAPSIPMRHTLGSLPSSDWDAMTTALLTRHSSPMLDHPPRLSANVVPECILMQTDVQVTGLGTREVHCVYLIQVQTGFGAHVIHKRYSEIRDLRTALLRTLDEKKHCGHGPCNLMSQLTQIKFPRRRLRLFGSNREADFDVGHERLPVLERFLQAILRLYRTATRRELRACTKSNCAILDMIKEFLDVAEPTVYDQTDLLPIEAKTLDDDLPFSFPELAHSTLCGNMAAPLYPIEEQPELASF